MARVLMLCHDQHLDRRVVAQALSLIAAGHQVDLIALSHGPECEEPTDFDGIRLFRVGLNRIVPSNLTYKKYIERQQQLSRLLNVCCNRMGFCRPVWSFSYRGASKANWAFYRALLLARYRNRRLHDPLPFTTAFLNAAAVCEADLIQVHDLPALEAGVQLAAHWEVPLVYDAHELYPEQRSFSTVQKKLCSDMEKQLIQRVQLVFAVNDSIGEEMERRYGIRRPITLLNAVDPPEDFDPQAPYNLLREKLALPSDRRILLFQGGFAPHRNLERLVEAMRLVHTPDIALVMMGFGEYGEKLRSLAARKGVLGGRVHFLPAVPQSELLQHSASADIGVIPYPHVDLNSYYCTPNKLFEFIQAGLPILANDSPELRRFVGQRNYGLVRPLHTAPQIAAAIDEIFAASASASWRQNLLAEREQFCWKRQSEAYLNAILPLLESAASSSIPNIVESEVVA